MLRVFTCVLLVALASAESHGGKTCVAIEATLKGGLCATKVFKGKTCIKADNSYIDGKHVNISATEATYGGMGALLTKDVCTATIAVVACSMYDGTVKTDFCTLSGGFCGDFIQKNDLFIAVSCKTDSDCMAPVAGAATKPCCDSIKSRTEDQIKMMCTGISSDKVTAAVRIYSRFASLDIPLHCIGVSVCACLQIQTNSPSHSCMLQASSFTFNAMCTIEQGDLARNTSVTASTCATTNCISAASRASIVPVAAIISAIVALATAF